MNDTTSGLDLGGFDLGAALGVPPETPKQGRQKTVKTKWGEVKVSHRMGRRSTERKCLSDKALEDAINRWAFREGDCYHCFSYGDVDFISFVKFIIRQQYCPYIAINTWVISGEDILDLTDWARRGLIGRVDLFLGEAFQWSRPDAYQAAIDMTKEIGSRLVIFRNHAKLVTIQGERFNALVESSANMNTNPRSENTVVTIDRNLVRECITFLSHINPFNRDTCGAAPYEYQEGDGNGEP